MTRLRIVVLGYIVRGPIGGLAWHHLQYVMGLARLGHDVYYLEDSDDYPACYDPLRNVKDTDPSYGLRFARDAFGSVGLGGRWAYYDAHTSQWLGPCADHAGQICATADLLLNVSGMNPLRSWLLLVPARAFIDTDPVFTQLRHLADAEARSVALKHTAFLSFGENIGRCAVPDDGFPWQPTRQPVVLEAWPVSAGPSTGSFSTVMQWDSYPAREYGGIRYGMKSDSFCPYADLPRKTRETLELAVGSPTAPRDLLRDHGWIVQDPLRVTRDPWTYQQYIRRSKAEFSVAKHGYVVSRSGWFSERSAAYLASGRPVVLQDTGFSVHLPIGSGLLAFSNPDEALAGIEEVNSRYHHHCRTARELASAYFDARSVLADVIERAMASGDSQSIGRSRGEVINSCRPHNTPPNRDRG